MLTSDLFGNFSKKIKEIDTGVTKISNDTEALNKNEVSEDDLGVNPKRPARQGSRPERGHEPVALYKYIKDVEEGSTEYNTKDPNIVVMDKNNNILDILAASVASEKYNLGSVDSIRNQLRYQDTTTIGDYNIGAPMAGQPYDPIEENNKEADYGDEYQAMVQRVKKLAKEGPRKTVWDPVKRVYKTVPVQQKKQQDVAEGTDELWRVLQPRNIGGHAARYYVVKGHGKDIMIWKNKIGAGDFIKQADAEAKAEELNKNVTEAQSAKTGIYQTDVLGAKAYHAKCMEPNCNWESKRFDRIKQAQAAAEKHAKDHFKQGVAGEQVDENLRNWFKEKWVRFGPDGKIRGACARGDDSEGKPKCLPQSKAHALGKKGRASAAAKKRREDPNPERRGPAKNVATKVREEKQVKLTPDTVRRIQNFLNDKFGANLDVDGELGPLTLKSIKKFMPASLEKLAPNPERTTAVQGKEVKSTNEAQLDEKCWPGYEKKGMKTMFGKRYPNCVKKEDIERKQCPHCGGLMLHESELTEKKDACYYKVKSRYKVWPSAYASGALVQCRKKGAGNWGSKSESVTEARSFNDDDWYEIDPETLTIVGQHSPRAFRHPLGDSKIDLPNGNIAVKGLRAKYMDLNDNKIDEAVSGLELADAIYNGLEQKYPDTVRRFGHEVVANAVLDAAENIETLHSMSDLDIVIDEIHAQLSGPEEAEQSQEPQAVPAIKEAVSTMEAKLYYNVIGTSDAELRREFGMRRDSMGWFLTSGSGRSRIMEAQRAFGAPKVL